MHRSICFAPGVVLVVAIGAGCGSKSASQGTSGTSAGAASSSEGKTGETDTAKIALQAVDEWVAAQNQNKLDAYLALYDADTFRGIKRTTSGIEQKYDFKGWKEERSRMFGADVQVAADDRQITTGKQNPTLGADVVEVRFTQRWKNPRYADHGLKVVRLRVKNGSARIFSEELISSEPGWDGSSPSIKAGSNKFVRARPESADRKGADACAYLGGFGFACLDAMLAEKNQVIKRYMRRMSDADARLAYDQWVAKNMNGVAHAEFSDQCADKGPCKGTAGKSDDGYACLTRAEMAIQEKNEAESRSAHERACKCGSERAQIPIMGGFLACQDKTPEKRGQNIATAEAVEIRACAECDAEKGAAACAKEVERLTKSDPELAKYIIEVHVPRCGKP